MSESVITISIEIELGWGGPVSDYISEGRAIETEYLDRLLSVCDELDIPITFNVVSKLFEGSGQHSSNNDLVFYAPDLIKKISDSTVDHEISTHTYSHFVYTGSTSEHPEVHSQLQRAIQTHSDFGLEQPISFVPPRNRVPPHQILSEHDIEVVRSPVGEKTRSQYKRFFDVLLRTHPVSEPVVVNDVVETHSTWETSLTAPYFLPMGRKPPHPTYRFVPQKLRKRIHRNYLKKSLVDTISSNGHCHHWTHLYNLSNKCQWDIVADFLRLISEKARENKLKVSRMCDLRQ